MDKYCQNCKQANPADATFCRNCSAPLAPDQYGGGQKQSNQQWNQPNQQNFANQPFTSPQGNGGGASTRATVALVLAIASLFCCGVAAIPAAIVGWMEVSAIKRGEAPQAGLVMAQLGMWGGIVITTLSVLGGFLYLLFVVAAVGSSNF